MVSSSSLVPAQVTLLFRAAFVLKLTSFWEPQGCLLLPLSPEGSFFPCAENDKMPSKPPAEAVRNFCSKTLTHL